MPASRAFLSLFGLVLGATGCAAAPGTYEMAVDEVRELRAGLGTVGVALSRYPVQTEFTVPAKGRAGGFRRGFAAGATTPVLIGFISPVPGGTLAGALVAPVTAIYGAFKGAASALPPETVDIAEVGIDRALLRLEREGSRQRSLEEFVQMARDRVQAQFVPLSGLGPETRDEDVRYSTLDLSGIDTVLEIRLERGGLWGRFDIDPPSAAYLEARVRLIRVSDDAILLEDTVTGIGEQRTYSEWGANGGRLFSDEILRLIPRLREKIIDDLFLVYPVAPAS